MSRLVSSPPVPTVLLVASYRDDREMYAEYLRYERFATLEAGTTAEALLLASRADVVVTGISVPGPFDGLQLIRRLRADERSSAKPIIVLTASAHERERGEAQRAGCDAFLLKPCRPDRLVEEIRGVLARPGSIAAVQSQGGRGGTGGAEDSAAGCERQASISQVPRRSA